MNALDNVMTLKEAADTWDIDTSSIRLAIR